MDCLARALMPLLLQGRRSAPKASHCKTTDGEVRSAPSESAYLDIPALFMYCSCHAGAAGPPLTFKAGIAAVVPDDGLGVLAHTLKT